jgi:hypothetical protein
MYMAYTALDKIPLQTNVEFRVYISKRELETVSPQELAEKICRQLMDEILPKMKNVLEARP